MRWNARKTLEKELGKTRIVKRYMWIPRRFGGPQWRWLEYAMVKEEVKQLDVGGSDEWGNYIYRWRGVSYAD